ncbi:Armadillo/beta-catenin-like repeat [Novymonas esmeraldas]|uniref:Armadillo/beta-catenin-like repeat n=1 Tax=Novymonas esmeraldas TaxID=1808958 RepID=A0AAW0F344_9TRYP
MNAAGCDIASLLGVLSSSEEANACPLASFARDLRSLVATQQAQDLANVLAQRSAELVKEEEKLNATKEMISITYDKLRAELTRVEAQMRTQERRLQEVSQQKKLCKVALNLYLAGEVPTLVDAEGAVMSPASPSSPGVMKRGVDDARAEEEGEEQPNKAAPEPAPMKNSPTSRPPKSAPAADSENGAAPKNGGVVSSSSSPRTGPAALTAEGLLALLQLPDVKENVLLNAIENYTLQNLGKNSSWMAPQSSPDILAVMKAVLGHLSEPRPPVQLAELKLISYALQATPVAQPPGSNDHLFAIMDTLVRDARAVPILTSLLSSVNDDVKCEVLECLAPLICETHALINAVPANTLSAFARKEFLAANGLGPLVTIVVVSTSEAVLERALILLWGLLTKDEKGERGAGGEASIRSQVRELGGLRAVLDLLYTDSLPILENVSMVIGYITREDASKREIRDMGGLEKITATLRHPSDSIKTKMAGAVWNCASNAENRRRLRELGAIPALLELLRSPSAAVAADKSTYEFVRENAAGALWNLSVEAENKSQIIEYGGVPVLVEVMSTSNTIAVVENASGTLWNCSATAEARPVIRKAGGIPVLLSLLNHRKPVEPARTSAVKSTMPLSDKIMDNIAGTLRNCAINDQNKPVIRECGGVELIVAKVREAYTSPSRKDATAGAAKTSPAPLSPSTVDKLASTLWILTIAPEIKHTVRYAGGIEAFAQILEMSSPSIAGAVAGRSTGKSASLFAPLRMPAAASKAGVEAFQSAYSTTAIARLPFAAPAITVPMSAKEKLVGVLRNCSTVAENRPAMIEVGCIRCLTSVVLDCYASATVFQANSVANKSSRFQEPSPQLKESVASAVWYLSREDKDTPRLQGGVELMCMLLLAPQQPSVVLEQVAGALSSLTVNNSENRDAIRTHGGLAALIQLVAEKASAEYPQGSGGGRAGKADVSSHTYAVLNALLTIRNCTVNSDENVRVCSDTVADKKSNFGSALLHIIEHGSEDCAKEAAVTVKNISAVATTAAYFAQRNGVALVTSLSERASSDSVRRAAASLLQVLSKAAKR